MWDGQTCTFKTAQDLSQKVPRGLTLTLTLNVNPNPNPNYNHSINPHLNPSTTSGRGGVSLRELWKDEGGANPKH